MPQHIGLVLAGGLSTRMGRDKSKLDWQGDSLLQYSYNRLASSYCQTVYISNNKGTGICDRFSQCGPLAGIDAVLQQLDCNGWLTIVPVDMPLLSPGDIIALQTYSRNHNRACYFERHPLPCVIPVNNDVKCYVEQQLMQNGNYSVKGVLNFVQAAALPMPESAGLLNTNTPEEWNAACQLYQESNKESQSCQIIA